MWYYEFPIVGSVVSSHLISYESLKYLLPIETKVSLTQAESSTLDMGVD